MSTLTLVNLGNDELGECFFARQIEADAASGEMVFVGTPTSRKIWRTADETLAAPDCGSYEGFRVVYTDPGQPALHPEQWICDRCGAVCDESDDYTESGKNYVCEHCEA